MTEDAVALLREHLVALAVRTAAPEAASGPALPASALFVNAQRAQIATALQRFERAGQARLSSVCRQIMGALACSFEPRAQWGVCALTGRTVRAMLLVRVSAEEHINVDSKFRPFLLGLWHFAHMETIEEARLDALASETGDAWDRSRAAAFYTDAEEDGGCLAAAYATSLHVVQQVIATTLRTLECSSGAPGATD